MDEIIILLDELGNEIEFKVLATFGLDDIDYAALMPADDLKGLTYLLRIDYDDDGQPVLATIDDEDEMEEVIKVYEEIEREKLQ